MKASTGEYRYSSTLPLTSVLGGVGFNATSRSLFPRERGTMPIVHEAEWAPVPFWMGAENLAPLGFDPKTVQPVASGYMDCGLPAQAGRFTRNLNKGSMAHRERILQGNSVTFEIKAQMGHLSRGVTI